MLFLLFQIGADRYALDTAAVLEIVPQVELRRFAQAPAGVAGLLDYHGSPVPVLDLSALAAGSPAEARFSTRLILVRTGRSRDDGQGRVIGLLAERATGTLRREPKDFIDPGLNIPGALPMGRVTRDEEGFIQHVRVESLLTAPIQDLLQLPPPAAATP